jgi:hypothetical protein
MFYPRREERYADYCVALIVLSAVSILAIGYLTYRGNRRKAAVGRVELRTLFVVCASLLCLMTVERRGY